jgi:hypothetical protein
MFWAMADWNTSKISLKSVELEKHRRISSTEKVRIRSVWMPLQAGSDPLSAMQAGTNRFPLYAGRG